MSEMSRISPRTEQLNETNKRLKQLQIMQKNRDDLWLKI
jgi:hypothetical protein